MCTNISCSEKLPFENYTVIVSSTNTTTRAKAIAEKKAAAHIFLDENNSGIKIDEENREI